MGNTSVGLRVVVYIVLVCLVLIGLDSWRSWNARTARLREMDVVAGSLAHAVADQAEGTFKETDLVLSGIVALIGRDGTGPGALPELQRVLAARVAELPQLSALSIYDADGHKLIASHAEAPVKFDYASREYFIFHRTHPGTAPHIGAPLRASTTGRWVIPVSRRFNRPDGSFGGVVLASVDIDFFRRFYMSQQIGRDGAIVMVLDSGQMLLRRPFDDSAPGADMTKMLLYRTYIAHGPVGTLLMRTERDGVLRLDAYRRLDHYPVFVAVALSKDEILSDWWHDTLLHSGAVAMLVVVVGLFGLRLVRQIRLRDAAEQDLIRARDQLTALNQTLEQLARFDGLTGLANRRQFDDALRREASRARHSAQPLALIMLDVDNFKRYNDTYGHLAGDDCLRVVSHAVAQAAAQRQGDLVARYGGEELAVLLPLTDRARALAIAERIRRAVEALQVPHLGNAAGVVTLSAGVCVLDVAGPTQDAAALIAGADRALYAAKRGGGNCVSGDTGGEPGGNTGDGTAMPPPSTGAV